MWFFFWHGRYSDISQCYHGGGGHLQPAQRVGFGLLDCHNMKTNGCLKKASMGRDRRAAFSLHAA